MKVASMKFKLAGGRIFKTGIAVFVTALICHLMNWPAMFAVITAIVTIEPTAADSIKKAFVRFPASAIGAGFSVLSTFLFGDTPISYTFVSIATIFACNKLKLHDGTIVAALTGVAMISTVHDDYLSSFLIRLGTTSTGLIVSSLVNLFVMPPNYSLTISNRIHAEFLKAGDILNRRCTELFNGQAYVKQLRHEFQMLINEIEKTETLCSYQKDEWRYHSFQRKEARKFHYAYKKLKILRLLAFHIGNLIYLPSHHLQLEPDKNMLLSSSIQVLRTIYYSGAFSFGKQEQIMRNELKDWFLKQKSAMESEKSKIGENAQLSPETMVLYELLSIYDLTKQLSTIHHQGQKHRKHGIKPYRG
ncbi:uncharacterized membrane protein YgaE (UPF0421/DUF939 family) [Mesobacillus foraminis]|uniref:Uncharacterized membrane protein YgaE (UPF0421/DUF939 family) n=2 Tax=Mesobacillus foraminis TaxID=279826 RepID=A0A4R2BDS7_9BACI|nr:uncharacterized membrane protein YgaE (UPF0421/DUF939 family) [Mesobacillus foraminis]